MSPPITPGTAATSGPGVCEVSVIHEAAVSAVQAAQAPEGDLAHLADLFQLLASPTRLRIVEALAHRELCVCHLSSVVGVSQSAVSHHLLQMRQLRVVRWRKDGRMAYYRLSDDHVADLFKTGLEHVQE
jgi:ArsR family transcriptional regulator